METLVDKSVTILCHKNSHKENMPQKIWLIVYEAFYFDSLKCFRWMIRKLEMDQKWVLARDHLIPRLKIRCWDVLLIHFLFQWEPTFASNWMPYSLWAIDGSKIGFRARFVSCNLQHTSFIYLSGSEKWYPRTQSTLFNPIFSIKSHLISKITIFISENVLLVNRKHCS